MVFFILKVSDCELQMNAVERITEYINKKEKEAEWDNP